MEAGSKKGIWRVHTEFVVAKKNVVLRVVAKKSLRALRTMKYFRYYLTNKVDDKTIVFILHNFPSPINGFPVPTTLIFPVL